MDLMKYSLLFLPVLLFNSCRSQEPPKIATNGDGNTLLWQISGKDLKKPSYLFGTFHLLCKEDISFSEGLKQAVRNADEIYLEMDLDDPANTLGAMFYMNMNGGRKLADLLSAEDYAKVTKFFKDSLGTGMMMVERMKPNFLQSLIFPKLLSCKKMSGVEQELLTLAKTEKKEVRGFETIAFQSSVFDSIPYEEQAKDLVKTIDSLSEYSVYFEKMVTVYRSQKLSEIESLFNDPQFNMDEKSQDIMLGSRNRNWVAQLKKLLAEKSLFIGVGAGHLVGKQGLLDLLKKEGYSLTPLKNK